MRTKKLPTKLFSFLKGAFYGTLISFGSLAVLLTAFSFHQAPEGHSFYIPLSVWVVFRYCLFFSLFFSLCFCIKRLWILVPVLLLCCTGYAWHFGSLKDGLYDFLYMISKRYDTGYGCGVILLREVHPFERDLTGVFATFAALGTAIVTWTCCKQQSAYWVLMLCLLCFIPCCVLNNTMPNALTLLLLFFALALYLLTNHSAQRDPKEGCVLSLYLSAPVLLALLLLFYLMPFDSNKGKDELSDRLLFYFEDLTGISTTATGGGGSRTADSVSLSSLGKRVERRVPVMYMSAPVTDTYYLRGKSYGIYTGLEWTLDPDAPELPWAKAEKTPKILSIRSRKNQNILYLPYCTDPKLLFAGGTVMENKDNLTEYQFDYYNKSGYWLYYGDPQRISYWLTLPEQTRSWAEPFVENLYAEAVKKQYETIGYAEDDFPTISFDTTYLTISFDTTAFYPTVIKEFVQSCGVYDLTPKSMDSSYNDFAQWFAEKGESGYCVHFASTAAVLLRAAGIPARYVSGYKVDARGLRESTVYQKDSHAWVEYWTEWDGWQILEATPPRQEAEETSSTTVFTTVPTESTTEPTTEPTTTTTVPTQSDPNPTVDKPIQGDKNQIQRNVKLLKALLAVGKWLSIGLGAVLLLLGQRMLRLRLYRRGYEKRDSKKQALLAWKRSLCYSKLLKLPPENRLRALAEKAKFSPHDISHEELEQFQSYFRQCQEKLKNYPIRRIYARWIRVLY